MRLADINCVIAHAPCQDGFSSAWVIHHLKNQPFELYEGNHEKDKNNLSLWLERVRGKNVVICDFSFERQMLLLLKAAAASLVLLDHHYSAQKELSDLDFCVFDQGKSGALLTWSYFSQKEAPSLIHYVSDHDLWQHKLPYSRELAAYISYQEKNLAHWDQLFSQLEHGAGINQAIAAGQAILAYNKKIAIDLSEGAAIWRVAGQEVLMVNTSWTFANDVCDRLGQIYSGAVATYMLREDGMVKFSLRSSGKIDVAALAVKFGGGGHKASASFIVPVGHIDFSQRILKVV